MSDKLIFPIGFDLEEGVKEASKEWKSTYQKQMQKAIDDKPLKVKIDFESKGIDPKEFKQWMALSREAEKIERERIKNAREWQKVADQQAMAETRRANATNESNARIERQNRKAEASERRKRDAVERTNAAYKTQSSYLQRLAQRMIAYASVTQVFSFLRNIREVTAEFELQRVALGSIIGDLNEANAMFEQIKAAAVKSPFQIKELVTYTKQLAAYKIDNDELFETTQRLADISAGIGVGMERLVLAYGQIRATGYLRASEVRQLTEAGIPIVEELAKKMSLLRGETVSAAEVMGMISERAISFGMVKEVFDDMTSAGGMFYKMQEKQAETLKGQWSNLQDSIAIMYEEIGNTERVNNAMKGMIGLIKSLAENWRVVGDVAVWSVGAAMGYAKVIKPLSELIQKHRLLNKAKEREMLIEKDLERIRSLNAHKELFADDAEYVQWADQEIDRLQGLANKHKEIASEARKSATALKGFGGALKSIGSFIKANWVGMLITAVTALVSWLISARQEANRLNKELAKIDTEGALQTDQSVRNFERLALAIRESADGSAKQTEALKEMKRAYGEFLPEQDKSIIELVRQKDGYNAVTQAIREKIALQIQEQKLNTIASEYGSRITKKETKLKDWLTGEDWLSVDKFSQEEATRITNAIRQAVSDGLISAGKDWEENAHTINKIIREQTGQWGSIDVMHGIERQKYEEFIDILYDMNDQVQQVEWSMESATGSLGKYTQAYKDFKEELKDVTGTGEKFSFEWNESKTKAEIKAYNEFIGNLLAKEGIKFDIGEAIDFKGLYTALGDNYPQLKQVVTKIQGEYEKLVPKDLEKLIKEQFSTLATKYGASLDKLQHYFKSADQSTQDWVKTLKDAKTELDNQIFDAKKLDKDTTALEAQKQVVEAMITAWDNSEKTQKAGAKSAEQALKDELAAVEKIYKRYQDLRKLKSETETMKMLETEFGVVDIKMLKKAYSPKQMLEVYQMALAEAQRLGKKDLVLEIQTKIGEFNIAEEQRKLEKSLKDLSDKISRTKTAKEFFDRMLGLTGDKQLSATLTMSVYGEGGEDLGTKLAKQTADAFKKKYEGVDFSKEAISDEGVFDWNKILAEGKTQKGKLGADEYDKFLKDVDEGQKASGKRLETLINELEKTKTYSEKLVDIYTNTQERLNTIDREVGDEPTRTRLKDKVINLQTKEIQKAQYDAFKDSPMYVAMFENLDATSTAMLTNMRDRLIKLKSEWKNLDPTQLKELQSRINEIDKQLTSRNPFKGIVDGIQELNKLKEESSRQEDEQKLFDAVGDREQAQKAYDDAVKDGKSDDEIKRLASNLQKCVDAEKEATKKMGEWDDATKKVVQGIEKLKDISQIVQSATTAVNDIVEAFGGWGDAADEEFWNTILDGINGLIGGIESIGTGIMLSMINPLAGIPSIISGIGSIFSSIGNLFYAGQIRRANKEIERQQELLDELSYSLDRLEKAQEKAFGSEYITNYESRLANLRAQQDAYLAQANAERSKGKKADSDKIKDYEKQAQDTADAIKDMQGEIAETLTGTDVASAARDFASAWIEAYKEFGSTTDAISKKFKDMIQNMIVESLAAKVMQTMLEPIFNEIDRLAQEGGEFSVQDASMIASMAATESGKMNEAMLALMKNLEAAGITVRDMGSGLTGISKDVATASEESILGLAAGINTQNFYISQVPAKLDVIISLMRGGSAVVDSGVNVQDLITLQNQFLSSLPSIAQNTADTVARCERAAIACERMASQLDRVIQPRGTKATHTVNIS